MQRKQYARRRKQPQEQQQQNYETETVKQQVNKKSKHMKATDIKVQNYKYHVTVSDIS